MKNPDRLYELLPVVHRQRDVAQGYPLRSLLRVIAEQVQVVEDDIAQLYENWFIETCEEWVVPYIGDLIAYSPVHEAGEPGEVATPREKQREAILIPRQAVANTIRARRRKGTLALLEELAAEVAGLPARAVEFYKLLGWTQNIRSPHLGQPRYHTVRFGDSLPNIARLHQTTVRRILWLNSGLEAGAPLIPGSRLLVGWRPARGQTVDLRDGDALDLLGGPFDRLAHSVEVRRINSPRAQGRFNIPSVGLLVWRLKPYSVTQTPAFCVDEHPHCYTFSVLGNDVPLFNKPQPETEPTHIAEELNLPTPIGRRAFATGKANYYGDTRSLEIWLGQSRPEKQIPMGKIVAADLTRWHYQPHAGHVAVDPVRGRLAFAAGEAPRDQVVWVSYHYGFSADIGGGEYDRPISQPAECTIYQVGRDQKFATINAALARWQEDLKNPATDEQPAGRKQNAVIEITDSGLYEESLSLKLGRKQTLQIRAANRQRPVLSLPQTRAKLDALFVSGGRGSRVILDGLLIVGRGIKISGPGPIRTPPPREGVPAGEEHGDLCDVTIRHCTLVPGWSIDAHCEPCRREEPSLVLSNTSAGAKIEHSIIGSIEVETNEAASDPLPLRLSDSIWDSTDNELPALNGLESEMAYVRLSMARCTVFGKVLAHEIALAENSIFNGLLCVARRQKGCVRFCYVPPDSRTPRRYACQPDLVLSAVQAKLAGNEITALEADAEIRSEQLRVEPDFNSVRYGTPTYCQLALSCAPEIVRGAEDESEMGAFHDLYQPQRAANLRARLDEYTPAGMEAGIIYAT